MKNINGLVKAAGAALLVALGVTVCVNVQAQVNKSQFQRMYTLKECLEEGIERNYSLKIVRNKQKISDNNATLGNAGFWPVLDLKGTYSGSGSDTETKLRSDNSVVEDNNIFNQTIDAGLNLSWTISEIEGASGSG